ncbi:MAG: hypothetical protein QW612_04565 [Candidatus Bathyarchaeia archaeon]
MLKAYIDGLKNFASTRKSYSPSFPFIVTGLTMSNPYLIAFVGTVGSGKSTHMKLLAANFRSKGLKVKVTLLKVGNLWAYPLYKMASIGWPIFKNRCLFKLWIFLDILAVSLKFLILIWLPFKAGHIVLVEEYLPAIVADYLHIARINGHPPKGVIATIAYIHRLAILAPFTSVFLNANDTILKERWKLRDTPSEKPEYLSMQRKLLLSLTKLLSHHTIYIDTSDSTVKDISHSLEYLIKLASS